MKRLFLAGALLAMAAANANAALFTASGTVNGESVSVAADFSLVGSDLQIILSNTSPGESGYVSSLLSGVFFDLVGGTLTGNGGSATASQIFTGVDPDTTAPATDIDYHWSFTGNATLGSDTYDYGLGGAGFGIFGPQNTLAAWNGAVCTGGSADPRCQGEPDGPPYLIAPDLGILDSDGIPAGLPFVRDRIVFLLPFTGSTPEVSNVVFTLGTAPEFVSDGGGGFDGSTGAPEPATLALFGLALAAGAIQLRRLTRK